MFHEEGLIIEIIVREASGAKIESYRFQLRDRQKASGVMNLLKNKYGFNTYLKRDRDIDWLDGSKNRW